MLIDVSETIIDNIVDNNLVAQQKNTQISQKALDIIEALDAVKAKKLMDKIKNMEAFKSDANSEINEELTDKSALKENNAFMSALLNREKQDKDKKKGLVFIQYNNQNKKEDIDKFRKELSEEWNAPGIEFIEEYSSPSGQYGDIRYFHKEEKELANELQIALKERYCPEKPDGCFKLINLSGKVS